MTNKHRYKQEILIMIGNDHTTAQLLHQKLRRIYPSIGLWTVYRNLTELVDEWKLMKTNGLTEHTIYERIKPSHGHVICKLSNRIFDINIDMIDLSWIEFPQGFTLEDLHISFKGNFGDGPDSCKGKVST